MAKLSLQILAVVVLTLAAMQSLSVEAVDCNSLKMMDDFDLTKYAGIWYVYEMYDPFFPIVRNTNCGYFTYTVSNDTFINGTYDYHQKTGHGFTYGDKIAKAQLEKIDTNKYLSRVGFTRGDSDPTFSTYTVLYTDYTSVSYVYGCQDVGGDHEFAFVMTRDPVTTEEQSDKLDEDKETYSNTISTGRLVLQVDECKYLPAEE